MVEWPRVWPPKHQVPLPKDCSSCRRKRRVPLQRGYAHQDILGGRKCVCHGAQQPGNGGIKVRNMTQHSVSDTTIFGLDILNIAISIDLGYRTFLVCSIFLLQSSAAS